MISALGGPAANMLAGMTAAQMYDYDYLIDKLCNHYDPSGRESTYRTQMSTWTRRHGESPDEFAEAITLLAQKAHPTHEVGVSEDDPITACITDEFAEAITLLAQKAHPTHEVGVSEDDPITNKFDLFYFFNILFMYQLPQLKLPC